MTLSARRFEDESDALINKNNQVSQNWP